MLDQYSQYELLYRSQNPFSSNGQGFHPVAFYSFMRISSLVVSRKWTPVCTRISFKEGKLLTKNDTKPFACSGPCSRLRTQPRAALKRLKILRNPRRYSRSRPRGALACPRWPGRASAPLGTVPIECKLCRGALSE